VFESRSPITGYDNSNSNSHIGAELKAAPEVFVYNAAAARLSCASCAPSGVAPSVVTTLSEALPASLQNTYMQRWISEDGSRVFFDTEQPLVSQDTNGVADVYEWERAGTGSCSAGSAVNGGGCVFLLSGGSVHYPSLLIDADAKGENVFFETRAKLASGDHFENLKLYDARVGGGFPESSLACTGTGCQGVPPAAPQFSTPSSTTFAGTGNYPGGTGTNPPAKGKTAAQIRAEKLTKALSSCRRKYKHAMKRRVACEKVARRAYGPPHKAKKSKTWKR
jgi:hypothetical protein